MKSTNEIKSFYLKHHNTIALINIICPIACVFFILQPDLFTLFFPSLSINILKYVAPLPLLITSIIVIIVKEAYISKGPARLHGKYAILSGLLGIIAATVFWILLLFGM